MMSAVLEPVVHRLVGVERPSAAPTSGGQRGPDRGYPADACREERDYRSARVHAILRCHGPRVERSRIERLMHSVGLWRSGRPAALPRRARNIDSQHGYTIALPRAHKLAPNFTSAVPNQGLVGQPDHYSQAHDQRRQLLKYKIRQRFQPLPVALSIKRHPRHQLAKRAPLSTTFALLGKFSSNEPGRLPELENTCATQVLSQIFTMAAFYTSDARSWLIRNR